MVPYTYYRLCESYRDADGKVKQRTVLGLGELPDFPTERERKELADLLTEMINDGTFRLCDKPKLYDAAVGFYGKWLEEKKEAQERADKLAEEARRKAEEAKEIKVSIKLKSLHPEMSRAIGAEHVCLDTVKRLGIREFLESRGWDREKVDTAIVQIIARAIYPYSEYKTVKYLRENSAVCEMFGLNPDKITKDTLYTSAHSLWDVHKDMEDFLHRRVCSMFDIDERILLFDLTNTYFEGRMEDSKLCRRGRSKEKRDDCKIVVLAAVVNKEGLLVRTEIFEGNRQDVSTLEDVIGSLEKDLPEGGKHLIVMDAGFSSNSNLKWLKDNKYDYITVKRSSGAKYMTEGPVKTVADNKGQTIRLQKAKVEGIDDTVLLVDSDAKTAKERSMYELFIGRYETGLAKIKAGIEGKGTKKRDKVNARLGRLDAKFPGVRKNYDILFTYNENDVVTSMIWSKNAEVDESTRRMHGKYLLQTSLDEKDKENIWEFYNVIRTVEETFKTLKSDLDIRPVFHKTDNATKAHLNLAVLAYWVVSTTKYRLKQKGINARWDELLRIMSTQQRVTMVAEQTNGHLMKVRRSTTPETKLTEIQTALGITALPVCSIKSVWLREQPPEKDPPSKSGG